MYSSISRQLLVHTARTRVSISSLGLIRSFSASGCVCALLRHRGLLEQQDFVQNFLRHSSVFEIEPEILTSFVKGLYIAKIDMKWVFPFPTLQDSRDLKAFRESLNPLQEFLAKNEINSAKLDEEAEIPKELIEEFKRLRLFGMKIPEEYGGLGLTNLKLIKTLEDISSADTSVNMMLSSHNLLGVQPILKFGTDEQKEKYLPKLASGDMIAAFCCNEVSCGSDINTMHAQAELSEDGKHWILSGEKTSINNGDIADVMIVFAKIKVTDVDDTVQDTIAAFIVERSFGGIYNGPQEQKMGMRALNTSDIMFDDTPVPIENMLGDERDGFKIATETMNDARLGLVGGIIGPMRDMVREATDYAYARRQFGRRIKDFELVQDRIFRMAQNTYAMESVTYLTMGKYDQAVEENKIPDLSVESAIAKVFCAQKALENANDCVELFGHRAYTKTLPYERILRDAKLLTLSEGTSDVLKLYIVLSCFKHSENFLFQRMRHLKHGTARHRIQYFIDIFRDMYETNYTRKGFLRKKIPSFGLTDKPQTKMWFDRRLQQNGELFERIALSFHRKVYGHIQHFGVSLNDEQMRLRRFAELTIALYSMIAVMARCNKSLILGLRDFDREFQLGTAYIHRMFRECNVMLEELQSNYRFSTDKETKRIGKEFLEERRYAIPHPLELEHKYLEHPIYLSHFENVLKTLPK